MTEEEARALQSAFADLQKAFTMQMHPKVVRCHLRIPSMLAVHGCSSEKGYLHHKYYTPDHISPDLLSHLLAFLDIQYLVALPYGDGVSHSNSSVFCPPPL